jgi:hypothetical protein
MQPAGCASCGRLLKPNAQINSSAAGNTTIIAAMHGLIATHKLQQHCPLTSSIVYPSRLARTAISIWKA